MGYWRSCCSEKASIGVWRVKISERVEARTHVPKDRLIPKPPIPTDAKIELTNRCNLNCSFCATGSNGREKGDMSEKTMNVLLDAFMHLGVTDVGMFLLGESLLRGDIVAHIKYAKRIGIPYVYLTTNGVLCTPSVFDQLKLAGLDSLKISLNAADAVTYKKVTGKGMYETVIENIAYAASQHGDMNFGVSCVYDEYHAEELKALKKRTEPLCDFYFLPKYNQAGHVEAPVCGNVGTMRNPVEAMPCWELFNAMRFTWDGYMAVCAFPQADDFKVGSIAERTIADLWHDEKMVNLREAHLRGDVHGTLCEKCIHG